MCCNVIPAGSVIQSAPVHLDDYRQDCRVLRGDSIVDGSLTTYLSAVSKVAENRGTIEETMTNWLIDST